MPSIFNHRNYLYVKQRMRDRPCTFWLNVLSLRYANCFENKPGLDEKEMQNDLLYHVLLFTFQPTGQRPSPQSQSLGSIINSCHHQHGKYPWSPSKFAKGGPQFPDEQHQLHQEANQGVVSGIHCKSRLVI